MDQEWRAAMRGIKAQGRTAELTGELLRDMIESDSCGTLLATVLPVLEALDMDTLKVIKDEVAYHRWANTVRAHPSSPLVAARANGDVFEVLSVRGVNDRLFRAAWQIQTQRQYSDLDQKRWRRENDRRKGKAPNPVDWPDLPRV